MAVLVAAVLLWMAVAVIVLVLGAARIAPFSAPRGAMAVPVLIAVVVTAGLMASDFRSDGQLQASAPPPRVAPVSSTPLAPVYPGPPTGMPLPKVNLPITYDYGRGPHYPVPSPSQPATPRAGPARPAAKGVSTRGG